MCSKFFEVFLKLLSQYQFRYHMTSQFRTHPMSTCQICATTAASRGPKVQNVKGRRSRSVTSSKSYALESLRLYFMVDISTATCNLFLFLIPATHKRVAEVGCGGEEWSSTLIVTAFCINYQPFVKSIAKKLKKPVSISMMSRCKTIGQWHQGP